MADRNEVTLNYQVNERTVTLKVMDAIGPEDCYNIHLSSVLHRYVTGEDLFTPTPRDVKDWMIKQNITV